LKAGEARPKSFELWPPRFVVWKKTNVLHRAVESLAELESVGELDLKGFRRPVKAFNVRGLRKASGKPT
jgi:hypothetical protein